MDESQFDRDGRIYRLNKTSPHCIGAELLNLIVRERLIFWLFGNLFV